MSKLEKKIQIRGCVFTSSVKLKKWSFHVADLPRTGKKCTEIKKKHVKGRQSFCFCLLNMQNLWRCRCRHVVDLKLSNKIAKLTSRAPALLHHKDRGSGEVLTCKMKARNWIIRTLRQAISSVFFSQGLSNN